MKDPLDRVLCPLLLTALIVLLSLAALPHVNHLNLWISGYYLVLVGLRLLSLRYPATLPGRALLLMLTFVGVINVLSQHAVWFDQDTGVALLTVMIGMKYLELKTKRDAFITVFLGYFLVATQFFYAQSIALAAYLLLVVIGLTTVLVQLNRIGTPTRVLPPLREAVLLLAQAMPVMLVLFVLFPRLSTPLWNLGLNDSAGVSGLGDRLSPGSISQLSLSRSVAFRAAFASPAPPPSERYWRGPTFLKTDGVEWKVGEARFQTAEHAAPYGSGEPVHYSVTLEPTNQRWLFALGLPASVPPGSNITTDFQILTDRPITKRRHYQMQSYTQYHTGKLSQSDRERALQLPDNVTPRMTALVNEWRAQAKNGKEIMRRALHHFRTEPFVYTLFPPRLDTNPVDEFLFETRRGFCEHYASSFTVLMRIAGIPARVVTGYQGGELNPHGDYYIVRQSDAHAWAEVWLDDQGWIRADPTGAVAPERIERSIDISELRFGAPITFLLDYRGNVAAILRQAGFLWDAVNSSWQRWVLGYNDKRQSQLLFSFGLASLQGYGLGIASVAATATVVALVALLGWSSGRERPEPAQRAYWLFCRRLERNGIARNAHEGPLDYGERVTTIRPDLEGQVRAIIGLYIGIRYGRLTPTEGAYRLTQLVRRFRP